MKTHFTTFLLLLGAPCVQSETLSGVDREAILERLEKIQEEAISKVDARFRTAISAYKSAMDSDNAALEFYLKCEEMVNFEEMKKKSGDFREWRRQNADRLSDAKFKMALRQQLRWLVLTLEAASKEPNRDKLAVDAATILDSILSQADELSAHRGILEQAVTSSVFARAYGINSVKVENWPLSPVQIQPIYDQILLPPLRRPDRLNALKAAWAKRMIHESTVADFWSGRRGEAKKSGIRSPEYDKFIAEALPKLQWSCEVDLFKAGDERAAAIRMLSHIESNITHPDARQWASDFAELLQKNIDTKSSAIESTP